MLGVAVVETQEPLQAAGTEKLETEHSEGEQEQFPVVEEQGLLVLAVVALVWL